MISNMGKAIDIGGMGKNTCWIPENLMESTFSKGQIASQRIHAGQRCRDRCRKVKKVLILVDSQRFPPYLCLLCQLCCHQESPRWWMALHKKCTALQRGPHVPAEQSD